MDILRIVVTALITFNIQMCVQPQDIQDDFVTNSRPQDHTFLEGEPSQTTGYLSAPFSTLPVYANFSIRYVNNVSVDHRCVFIYNYSETSNKTTAVRVTVSSKAAQGNFPTTFVVRQQAGILAWQVPVYVDYVYSYKFVDRTLCPVDKTRRLNMTVQQNIFVDVASMSREPVSFSLTASLLSDFELAHGVTRNVTASPSQPQYYMYGFPEGVDTVLLRVTSSDDLCSIVSVQQIKCPVMDLDSNIGYGGKHQTLTTQAAMFLERSNYPGFDAFYLVIVVKPNNAACSVQDIIRPPHWVNVTTKTLSILITDTIPDSKYYVAVFAALGVFVGFYLVAAVVGCIYHGCGCHHPVTDLTDAETEKFVVGNCSQFGSGGERSGQGSPFGENSCSAASDRAVSDGECQGLSRSQLSSYGSIMKSPLCESHQSSDCPDWRCHGNSSYRGSIEEGGELDTSDVDFLHDADSEKDILRTKTLLVVSDLARKSYKRLSKTFKVYHWNLLTIAIFYGLPAAQLVLTYQRTLLETGNEDLCYYNFECAHPVGRVSAFNNIISNMGYVLLGLLFILLVWRRDLLHRKLVSENLELERHLGIPQYHGLLYAMGLALVMEGIMSACYHVCPNYSNFQFDTSFMYIIACLCMLKIYETRHPDVQAKAYKSYFFMAFLIFIAVLGVVYGSNIFWIFYALVHMLVSLVLSAQVYYVGRIKMDRYVFKRLFVLMMSECFYCMKPLYPTRFLLLLVGNLVNWAFALYGAVVRPLDFASFLLAIFIGNLLLYLLFYIVMKLLSGERINMLTAFCICAAGITWAFALYFFFHHLSSWQISPALSRQKNQPCILLGFYDAHDVWHFLSAVSMFFSFLILLTLDDDLVFQRRDKIRVF